MTTDNWPVDFRYISKRLVHEIVQQDDAARGPWRLDSAGAAATSIGVGLRKRSPDYGNLFDLARRSTEAVRDNTGTLDVGGKYVRGDIHLKLCDFQVLMGWKDVGNVRIAAVLHDGIASSGERVFVGLFGSVGNYVWNGSRPKEEPPGLTPSDVTGLYTILEAAHEAGDPRLRRRFVKDDARLDDVQRCALAYDFTEHARPYEEATFSFLARAYWHLHDVLLDGVPFETVLLGTPIWIATPEPKAR